MSTPEVCNGKFPEFSSECVEQEGVELTVTAKEILILQQLACHQNSCFMQIVTRQSALFLKTKFTKNVFQCVEQAVLSYS